MNKKHFLNLSQKYDQTGDYKKADQLFRQAQFYKTFVPDLKPIQMEGSDPFINASSSPEALQGTLGYTAAGNSAMPGGFISDVKSEDVPFVVPFTIILTPGSGIPVSPETVPEIVFSCANVRCTINANNSVKKPLNFDLI